MQTVFSRLRPALTWIFLALALGACFGVQAQQSWPNRVIRVVVPFQPTGSADLISRLVGQKLSESLGQPVIIENRGGANGVVGASYFVKAVPDNHFFLLVTMPMLSINQHLYRELGYDPDADLKPIGIIATTSNVIVAFPGLHVHTLKELVEYGRTHPNKFSYGTPGVGTTGHLLNELFKADAGIDMLHVPYRGEAPAIRAVMTGEVQFMSHTMGQMLAQIRAGKMQALAVTSPKRLFQLPEVPTAGESGFPKMTMVSWWGLAAQSKTQPEVIARMNRELVAILQKPDFIARMRELNYEPSPGTPEDMTAAVRSDRERWKKAIEMAGIKPE